MKTITALFALLPCALFAQTTWEVNVGGSLLGDTLPYYEPAELTIQVNDVVHWVRVSGTHNVYGEQDMFPNNPEGFSSGEPTEDLDYSHTFTIPGTYMYHCTQQDHAATQHGMITVLSNPQNVEDISGWGRLALFPVPAEGVLNLELEGTAVRSVYVLSVDGRVQRGVAVNGLTRAVIDVDGLASGRYLLRLVDDNGRSIVRPFVKS